MRSRLAPRRLAPGRSDRVRRAWRGRRRARRRCRRPHTRGEGCRRPARRAVPRGRPRGLAAGPPARRERRATSPGCVQPRIVHRRERQAELLGDVRGPTQVRRLRCAGPLHPRELRATHRDDGPAERVGVRADVGSIPHSGGATRQRIRTTHSSTRRLCEQAVLRRLQGCAVLSAQVFGGGEPGLRPSPA